MTTPKTAQQINYPQTGQVSTTDNILVRMAENKTQSIMEMAQEIENLKNVLHESASLMEEAAMSSRSLLEEKLWRQVYKIRSLL